jgi:hypothetical protein|tara:strand:- start:2953 stop:3348 length:396 start_codon:yes stop_codon:yes gene_type:complete
MRSYSVSLFLGSVDSKSGKSYTKSDLRAAILSFQSSPDVKRWPPEGFFPVRITETEFVSPPDYHEGGWEVTAIQYPRSLANRQVIFDWMDALAEYLSGKFNQNRICVMDSERVTMFERVHEGFKEQIIQHR